MSQAQGIQKRIQQIKVPAPMGLRLQLEERQQTKYSSNLLPAPPDPLSSLPTLPDLCLSTDTSTNSLGFLSSVGYGQWEAQGTLENKVVEFIHHGMATSFSQKQPSPCCYPLQVPLLISVTALSLFLQSPEVAMAPHHHHHHHCRWLQGTTLALVGLPKSCPCLCQSFFQYTILRSPSSRILFPVIFLTNT